MAPKPPGPPPPPPPGPPPPPAPVFAASAKGAPGGDNRNALLSSIRQGAKLKKTVTIDKSAPLIPGKVSNNAAPIGNGVRSSPAVQNGGMQPLGGLGGLFAGGMPKLRPTGKLAGAPVNGQVKTEAPQYPPPQLPQPKSSPEKSRPSFVTTASNVSALSAVLSDALAARESREAPIRPVIKRHPSEVKTRGPPPQPPPPQKNVMPLSTSDSVLTTQPSDQRLSSNVANTLQRNKSALHSSQAGIGGSMTSLSSAPPTPTPSPSLSASDLSDRPSVTRVHSHGKPNLAPKPPAPQPDRPSPPPKKLIMNGKIAARAQSMRVPRSPPVSPPEGGLTRPAPPPNPPHPPVATKNPASHFGTLRPGRGMLRPPGVSPPPPPGAPPPPPPARHASLNNNNNQPPLPPPPTHLHLRQNSHNGPTDETGAPIPPVRGSSKRNLDLDARFADLFTASARFPPPDAFLRISKAYSSATIGVSSKAPAPPPPMQVPLEGWSGGVSAC